MYYFAYGSNMNHQQMKERCPGSRFLGRAYLKNYKLVYDGYSKVAWKGPVANVIEYPGAWSGVGLFDVSTENITALDVFEGYPTAYDRKELEVFDDKNGAFKAYVYLREGKPAGVPSAKYRGVILAGAADCGLPEEYIKSSL